MYDHNNGPNGGAHAHKTFPPRGHHFQHRGSSPRQRFQGPPPQHAQPQGQSPESHHHNAPFSMPPPSMRWRGPRPYGGFQGGPPRPPHSMQNGPPMGPPPRPPGNMSSPGGPPQRYPGPGGPRPRFRGNGRGGGQKRNWSEMNGSGQNGQSQSGPNKSKKKSNNNNKNREAKDPSTLPFYCKHCDKGYNQETQYQQHVDTHVKCGEDGCPYIAAEKLVEIHRQMQHQNGLALKIWKLESPEEIAKWKAERRKNFPTKENIAQKAAIRQEKIQRGEVLETKEFGKFGRGRHNNRGRRGKSGGRFHNKKNNQGGDSTAEATESAKQDTTSTSPVEGAKTNGEVTNKVGDPMSYLLKGDAQNGSDSDEPATTSLTGTPTPQGQPPAAPPSPTTPSMGLGLLADYGEVSSEDDEEGEIKDDGCDNQDLPQTTLSTTPEKSAESPTDNDKQTSPTGGDGCNHDASTSHHNGGQAGHNAPKQKNKKNKKKNSKTDMSIQKRQLSLLEKLLAPDIRHERNVILQCIRHIRKNDFFGVGQNNNNAEKENDKSEPLPENQQQITFADTIQ